MQHLNALPCRHVGISLYCFVKTDLFYSLCHAVSVFWTCISCRYEVCWLKLNTFQAHCDYHKNHTAKYTFNYFMLHSKAATFVSRQTRMYCLYRTDFLSNHLFNQCELNICEIIASLTHFTFCESEKTTVFYVAFYSGRIPADS